MYKIKWHPKKLVFGVDVNMDIRVELSKLATVGKAWGHRLGAPFLIQWT